MPAPCGSSPSEPASGNNEYTPEEKALIEQMKRSRARALTEKRMRGFEASAAPQIKMIAGQIRDEEDSRILAAINLRAVTRLELTK